MCSVRGCVCDGESSPVFSFFLRVQTDLQPVPLQQLGATPVDVPCSARPKGRLLVVVVLVCTCCALAFVCIYCFGLGLCNYSLVLGWSTCSIRALIPPPFPTPPPTPPFEVECLWSESLLCWHGTRGCMLWVLLRAHVLLPAPAVVR
jgi:hypothetical protein